ncbi:hypothetical protein LTR64_008078 [Lithohypha guttulata]|uniref:uncharacterized protein n=1 Tax=Lithohypha guttulata TaxID=1690604 RepID=UPI00315D0DCE
MTQITYGHVFHDIAISGHARAIFGDVHVSCPDFLEHLTPIQKRKALLNALFYEDMHRRSAHIENARPKTCDWIWSTAFADWLAEPHPNTLFWISGKPGSGKSTLMKHLSTSKETRSKLPGTSTGGKGWSISHFFFDFRAAKGTPNTEQGLLRSLLYQITSELPLERDVLAKYELTLEQILSSQQADKMIDMLAEVIRSEKLNVLFFVDGLDEYEHDIRELIRLLEEVRSRTKLRLCLASRPEPAIQAMLNAVPQIKVQNFNASGIEVYVRTTIKDLRTNVNYDQTIPIEPSITYILDKAEGVFLWVHFAVNTFLECLVIGCVESEIRGALELLPTQLDKMYDRLFEQVPSVCRNEASMVLLLVESASHVVDLVMLHRLWLFLYTTLGLGPTDYEKLSLTQFQLRLRGFLGGLLDFEICIDDFQNDFSKSVTDMHNQTVRVRLLHETLRAYMRDRSQLQEWRHPKLSSLYHDNAWLRVYTEVLDCAHSSLQRPAWDIVCDVEQQYKLERISKPQPWRAARAKFLSYTSEVKSSSEEDYHNKVTNLMLPYAVLNLMTVATATAVTEGPLFESYSRALQNPIVLLFDTLQGSRVQIGLSMKYRAEPSICDLALAAARAWTLYFKAHRERLRPLSRVQIRYLIVCACGGSTTFDSSQPAKVYSGIFRDDTITILDMLFEADSSIDNTHVAFLMQSQFSERVAPLLTTLEKLYKQSSESSPKTSIELRQSDWSKFTHSLSHAHGVDLIEFWLRQDQPIKVFDLWLAFFRSVGFNLHEWQDKAGNNAILHVLETFRFDNANLWVTADIDINVFTIQKALSLEEFGLRLPIWTPAGRSMFDKLRETCNTFVKGISQYTYADWHGKKVYPNAVSALAKDLKQFLRVAKSRKRELPMVTNDAPSVKVERPLVEVEPRTGGTAGQSSEVDRGDQEPGKAIARATSLSDILLLKADNLASPASQTTGKPSSSSIDDLIQDSDEDNAEGVPEVPQNEDESSGSLSQDFNDGLLKVQQGHTSGGTPLRDERSHSRSPSAPQQLPELQVTSAESPREHEGLQGNASPDQFSRPLRPRKSNLWAALRRLRPKSIG